MTTMTEQDRLQRRHEISPAVETMHKVCDGVDETLRILGERAALLHGEDVVYVRRAMRAVVAASEAVHEAFGWVDELADGDEMNVGA